MRRRLARAAHSAGYLLFATLVVAAAIVTTSATARAQTQPQSQNQTPDPPTIRINRVSAAPALDDFVNNRIPDGYAKVSEFRQREPGDGTPASKETTAYFGYDERNFYVVFVCKQDPAVVRAHLTRREAILSDDVVGVVLDTYHDRWRAYEFLVNPLGIQLDGITTEGQNDDFSFDTLWHSGGRVTPDGFVTWMAIPFKSLRFIDAQQQTWGVAFLRIIPQNNETSFWPVVTRRIQSFWLQLATLEGLERISPGRNLQFIPYAAGTAARFLDEPAAGYATRAEGRLGLDSKVVVKDAVTLDLTLNPDFSQVESDEPQVTINQRFEVFFPEKRPFFIENAGMFVTPENLFFSRRIVNPQFGARVTGKLGRWAVAGVAADDRSPGEQFGANPTVESTRAFDGVVRLQREIARQSSAGLLATTQQHGTSDNTVVALDTRLAFTKNWTLIGQAAFSDTTRPGVARKAGQDYNALISYSSRSVYYETGYLDRSPGFESDLGYIPRVDIRQVASFARYTWYPKKSRLLSFGPSGDFTLNWNRLGQLQDWEVNPEFQFEFPGNSSIQGAVSRSYELFDGIGFDKRHVSVSASSEWLRWLSVNFSYRGGQDVNYYPAPGMAPFLGDSVEDQLGATWRPTSQFTLEETYIYNRLRTDGQGTPPDTPHATDVFRLNLWRTKASFQFTRALSLRAIVDYNIVNPNQALISLTRDARLTGDILVTYLVNPGTAIYVGYNDQYANVRVDPTLSPPISPTSSPSTSIGRQVFVKVSYLLRY